MSQLSKRMSNQEIGKRFKDLINEYDCKQEVTANYLKKCKTTISRYCSGTCQIPDSIIKKCAKKWNVREEYIKCLDDYKTYSDMYFHGLDQQRHDFGKVMNYLELFGFRLSFAYWITCPATKYELFKDELAPYIPTDSSGVYLCYPLEYEVGDKNTFLFDMFSRTEVDQLIANSYLSIYIPITNLDAIENRPQNVLSKYFDKIYELPTTTNFDFANDCVGIAIGYLVKNNGRDCGFYTVEQLERLFYVINSHTKCCIDLFVSGRIY